MAGVSEKARFYLEKAVPQLREWEDKEIFTKDELRTIVQKRSDFEHRVLAPGNTPADYLAYAAWEKSLDALRLKRCQRLKIRHLSSAHTAQVKLLSIYDRAVSRHPAHRQLWLAYLDYAAHIKATKRWRIVVTRALRMRPTDAALWIMAARRMASSGDMASARRFFMRACRFCVHDGLVWAEYARCEMQWLAKLVDAEAAKKSAGKKPSTDKPSADAARADQVDVDDQISLAGSDADSDSDEDDDGQIVRGTSSSAVFSTTDKAALTASNPALDGALPTAIFTIARSQNFWNAAAAELFFDVFCSFRKMPLHARLVDMVQQALDTEFAGSPTALLCRVRRPVAGVSPLTAEFPRGLREVVPLFKEVLQDVKARASEEEKGKAVEQGFKEKAAKWLDGLLATEGLDGDIGVVLGYLRGLL
ncbi:hypothetical protein TD95_000750 [Thielaviopsis punctulata]|uniref:U3 small nucleolar RNA-associated protein 6 N-terminal domain-containing protein n=1 Tax=Thielaviopsis punctulata TaxID=72032 RepID=A0A0F4ZLX1_9PEZI|nr:hypothetical protein TD95_000750 [Thielaviopsis punctulata]